MDGNDGHVHVEGKVVREEAGAPVGRSLADRVAARHRDLARRFSDR